MAATIVIKAVSHQIGEMEMIVEKKTDGRYGDPLESKLPILGTGVIEIGRNSRIILPMTILMIALIEHVPPSANNVSSLTPLTLLSYLIATFAGITVLLKAPYGMERASDLDSSVHRGISLFYGLQLGAFMIGLSLSAIAFVFG